MTLEPFTREFLSVARCELLIFQHFLQASIVGTEPFAKNSVFRGSFITKGLLPHRVHDVVLMLLENGNLPTESSVKVKACLSCGTTEPQVVVECHIPDQEKEDV